MVNIVLSKFVYCFHVRLIEKMVGKSWILKNDFVSKILKIKNKVTFDQVLSKTIIEIFFNT